MAGEFDEEFNTYMLCCDTMLSWLAGDYGNCIPDLPWILGYGRDCTDNADICQGSYKCNEKSYDGVFRYYCE
jgi:hypothetical protein